MTPAHLIEVAAAIADGIPVDWDRIASHDSTLPGNLVAPARIVERIAQLHASLPGTESFGSSLHKSLAAIDLPGDPGVPTEAPISWGPLTIIGKIGSGTYGDVYRAHDSRLNRPVALKLLRRRDRRESAVIEEGHRLARVRHPNVVAVYGAERIDDRVGLWMEYVDGRTLEEELKARGPFAAEEVARIGIDLARALAAVHRAGLLHRDLKAQNVMRDVDGRVLLTDFGAGRELHDTIASGSHELAGTPLYLAPEVLEGNRATPASDVYGLGVLLHHLATGSFPVRARTLRDLQDARSLGTRERVRTQRPAVSKSLASVIDRATEPDPARRYRSADELDAALAAAMRRVPRARMTAVAAAIVMVVSAVGYGAWRWRQPSTAARLSFQARDPILIARFDNRTADPALDGVFEYALERELSNSAFVNVVPRDRVADGLRLMKKDRDTPIDVAVGREISMRDGGIRALIAGRVERIGNAYTISLQIVKPADGSIAGTVSENAADRNDLLPASRRAALRLRERLGEALPAIEASRTALAKVTTPSLKALQLYSKAVSIMSADTPPDSNGAPQLLRAALVEDPQFVAAHILLGHAIPTRMNTASEALQHAELAWRSADGVSEVERLFASANYYRLRGVAGGPTGGRPDLERAAAEYEALLRVQPDHYWGLTDAAQIYQWLHNYSQARVLYAQIADARPVSFVAQARAAVEAFRAGDLDQAHAFAARAHALPAEAVADPFWAVWLDLMPAHEAWLRGDAAAALAEVDAVAARGPRAPAPFMRFQFGRQIIALYVTLGALARAEAAVSSLPTLADQNDMLAVAASQRADGAALRALLTSRFTTVSDMARVPSLFLQAGLFDQVRAILGRWRTDPTTRAPGSIESLEGRLAVVQGRPDAAIPLLERSRQEQWDITGGPGPLQIARAIASAWAARGDAAQAIQVLEATAESRALQAIGHSGGYEWIRNRALLADLYRKTNRIADARKVENELRQLLAVADGDHAIKLALEGRNE